MRWLAGLALVAALCTSCGAVPAADVVGVNAAPAASVSGRLLYVRGGSIEELAGGSTHELAKGSADAAYMDPAWSPDGAQIAFALRHKDDSDLGLMQADGSGQTFLTHNASDVVAQNLWAAKPAWSPDGSRLVYSSDRGKDGPNIDLRLWQLTLASRAYSQLTVPDIQAGGDADAAYRPGHPGQVVYTRWSYDANATSTYATLVLLDLNTKEHFALTTPKDTDFQPAWSPDGKTLAFIRRGPSSDELYAAPVPDTLTADIDLQATLLESGVVAQPCWSPDGSELAYIGETDNQFDLFRVGVATVPSPAVRGKPTRLTGNGVDASSRPSWAR